MSKRFRDVKMMLELNSYLEYNMFDRDGDYSKFEGWSGRKHPLKYLYKRGGDINLILVDNLFFTNI